MLADPRTHNDAFVALVQSAGVVVGDATAPTVDHGWAGTPGQSDFVPYCIVYPLTQGFDGSLGCPDVDSTLAWQVTCVGSTREQCDWVKGKVDSVVVGAQLVVNSRFVPRIYAEGGTGTRRDDTVQPPVFIATPRYTAMTFPSASADPS